MEETGFNRTVRIINWVYLYLATLYPLLLLIASLIVAPPSWDKEPFNLLILLSYPQMIIGVIAGILSIIALLRKQVNPLNILIVLMTIASYISFIPALF